MARLDRIVDNPSATPVIFNLHEAVGQGFVRNLTEDVFLIQTYFNFLGKKTPDAELRTAASRIVVSGMMDTATREAILIYQKRMHSKGLSGPPDGKVSPTTYSRYGRNYFMLPMLSMTVRKYCLDIWPRIDKLPGAHLAIGKLVQRELTGHVSVEL